MNIRFGVPARLIMSVVFAAGLNAPQAAADVKAFPPSFIRQDITMNGAGQFFRIGGSGPAVLLLHGFGDSGDMWEPVAVELAKSHTVIIPDLRGMGLSDHPEGGYEKASQATAFAKALYDMGIQNFDLVTHDIGNMVGYRLAIQYPDRVTKWVIMDAPLPGLGNWDKQLVNPKVWHFNFRGPDVERLVAGRERILLDRFYNELSADPSRIDEQTRNHYAELYARGRHPRCLRRPVRGVCTGRQGQPGDLCREGKAEDGDPGGRRRPFLWGTHEGRTAFRR